MTQKRIFIPAYHEGEAGPLDSEEVAALRLLLAERAAEREKNRPTPELLFIAATFIDTLVHIHPEIKGKPGMVLGCDWKHLVSQLRTAAKFLEEHL